MSTPAAGGAGDDRSAQRRTPPAGGLTADDVDLDLVAEDLADALEPARAAALQLLVRTDARAAERYAGFARLLDGLAAAVAAEPVPGVPDDVLPRLDAALEREIQSRDSHTAALAANSRRAATAPRRRAVGRWAGSLGAIVALAAVVTLVVHLGGGSSGSSSTSAAASGVSTAAASERAQAGSGSAAAGGAPTDAVASAAPAGTPPPPVVTAGTLPSLVRSVYGAGAPRPMAGPSRSASLSSGPVSPVPAPQPLTSGEKHSPLCRPAGVSPRVTVLAETRVTFAGAPAVLVVLAGSPARPGTVRASILRSCGGPALLTREVTLAP